MLLVDMNNSNKIRRLILFSTLFLSYFFNSETPSSPSVGLKSGSLGWLVLNQKSEKSYHSPSKILYSINCFWMLPYYEIRTKIIKFQIDQHQTVYQVFISLLSFYLSLYFFFFPCALFHLCFFSPIQKPSILFIIQQQQTKCLNHSSFYYTHELHPLSPQPPPINLYKYRYRINQPKTTNIGFWTRVSRQRM